MIAAPLSQTFEADADLTLLVDHPDNPRQGDDNAVANSVDEFGFYGAIIVQRSTNRILAGHTRRRVLQASGRKHGPVMWLDCTDDTARRILLADNRTAELAAWDDKALADLLADLGGVDDGALLAGTGFNVDDLAAISDDLSLPLPPPSITRSADKLDERADRAERYETTTLRQITLVMQRDEYEPLVVQLEQLRMAWGMSSFAQVVVRLVNECEDLQEQAREAEHALAEHE